MKSINLTLFFLIFGLNACIYPRVKLNEKDKALIPYQQNKFILHFKDTQNRLDSMFFTQDGRNWASNFGFWWNNRLIDKKKDKAKPFNLHYSYELQPLKIKNDSINLNLHLRIHFTKTSSDNPLQIFIENDDWIQEIIYNNNYQSGRIEGIGLLDDLIIIENNEVNFSRAKKIFWSIKYGLVKIEKIDGSTWVLMQKQSI